MTKKPLVSCVSENDVNAYFCTVQAAYHALIRRLYASINNVFLFLAVSVKITAIFAKS